MVDAALTQARRDVEAAERAVVEQASKYQKTWGYNERIAWCDVIVDLIETRDSAIARQKALEGGGA